MPCAYTFLKRTGAGSETIPHAVTSVTRGEEEDTYAYDENGTMTCRVEVDITFIQTYNAENRISTVQKLASGDCETPGDLAAPWAFAYDGDGVRTATLYTPYVDGDPQTPVLTAYYFGGLYEVTGESVRKYYALAGQTVAMDDGDGLKYFLTDHLGSVLAVLDDSGAVLSEQRYLPFGQVREDIGSITQTDFGYTFQRNLPDMGLMDYRARFYSQWLGRFIQPDPIIPDPTNPQSWNRFSYTRNNPINKIDPSGNDDCSPTDVDCVKNDLGITFVDEFTDEQKTTIVEAAYKLAHAMGGSEDFRRELGSVEFSKKDMEVGGLGRKHHVTLNSNDANWDDWTVVHELAHSWDAANQWSLSKDLESETGGFTYLRAGLYKRAVGACDKNSLPGCNNWGYFYGEIPAKGSDRNFNRREDFAESVTTYVLGQDRAKDFLNTYYPNDAHLHYPDYTKTTRWKYIDNLMAR